MSALEEIGQTAAAAKDYDQTDERPMFVKGLTKEEEDMSDAERIAYLREVHVILDTCTLCRLASCTDALATVCSCSERHPDRFVTSGAGQS